MTDGVFAPEWLPASLHCTLNGGVALLRLARPEKRNAIDNAMVEALRRFFTDPPDGVRAVVLRGEGEHFSAGLDLSDHLRRTPRRACSIAGHGTARSQRSRAATFRWWRCCMAR